MTDLYSRIIATGSYLPEKIIPNQEFEKWLDTSDAWISERTGIHNRHIAAIDETAATMAILAAKDALNKADFSAETIDLIIVATCTPDYAMPNTACVVQNALGIKQCAAYDLSVACSGFSYALANADAMLRTGMAKRALVIGSEVMSRMLDWSDRTTCVLFGDGAGAAILEVASEPGIVISVLRADGRYGECLYAPNLQFNHQAELNSPYLKMQGREIYKLAVQKAVEIIDETLTRAPEAFKQIDWLIPHQANARIIETLANQLKLPKERVIMTLQNQGNTSAASVPLALDYALSKQMIKRGQNIFLLGFGGGFTWASNLIRY